MPTPLPPAVSLLERRLGLPEGDLSDEDLARAEAALDDATEEALSYVPDKLAELWRADVPGVVLVVILKAARREYENPQGFRQEGLGEHNATVETASGVYLTPHEIRRVKRAAGLVGFAGTVRIPSAYYDPPRQLPMDGPVVW